MTGIEEILIAGLAKGGASSVAKVATDSLLDGGGWLAKTLGNSLREGTKQAIYSASNQYVRNYAKRHCILKIRCVGMGEPWLPDTSMPILYFSWELIFVCTVNQCFKAIALSRNSFLVQKVKSIQ